MNNNFVFKIFGAPTTFDLYQGSGNEISYFQNFDNGSKEKTKLTIHRMASGKVSYSYLRYNFISSGGRPNSFFGMSVLFDKEYCKDIEKIFNLFDTIYKSIILENGILLTELKDNPAAQAKYIVRTFAEADSEVKNVENNILNNLKKHFVNDIVPLDNSFLESNSMVNLNNEMDNAVFVNALRKYSWVNISSEYSKNETPIPNPEFLADLDGTIEEVLTQMPIISVKALKGVNIQRDINNYIDKTSASLGIIYTWLETEYKLQKGANLKPYLQKQPELKERHDKLIETQKPLNDLLNAVVTTETPPSQLSVEEKSQSQPQTEDKIAILFWKKHKLKLIVAACFVVLIVAGIIFFTRDKKVDTATISPTKVAVSAEENSDELVRLGNDALDKKDFDKAIDYFKKANRSDLVEDANRKAINYFNEQAAEAQTAEKSIEILEKTRTYGGKPDVTIAEYQKQIAAAEAEKKQKNDKAEKDRIAAEKKKKDDDKKTETPTYPDVTIQLSPKKRIYSVKEKFTATATNCAGARIEWRYENGLYADKTKNPTTIEVTETPSNGQATLRCYIDGKQVQAVVIRISQ